MKTKQVRSKIEEAIRSATMERASFGFDQQINRDIKMTTRLYRDSWIITPLIMALAALDPCPDCKGSGYCMTDGIMGYGADCKTCEGFGMKDGLRFDPYKLSADAAEGGRQIYRTNEKLREVLQSNGIDVDY